MKKKLDAVPRQAVNNPWSSAPVVGAAVAVLAATVYANALGNGLVWDDPIVLTRQLLAFQSLRDLVFLPRNIPQFSPDYYRPLTIVSYLIDRAVAGSSPFMFHLSVVLWHAVTTYLVFCFGLTLFRHTGVAMVGAGIGAAFFAVHPIHTESVAWGAGRSDVLACAFSLAAALVYFSDRGTALRRAALSAALVLTAALAKETAVVFFVLIPGSDLLFKRDGPSPVPPGRRSDRRRRSAKAAPPWLGGLGYLPFAAALAVYLALRQASLGAVMGAAGEGRGDVAPRVLGAIGHYAATLILPVQQCAYISDLPVGPIALAGIGVLLLALAVAGYFAWRRGERVVVFLLIWMAGTLAPSLAIVIKIPAAPVAERYLYIPSVGYCLLLGYGAARLLGATGARSVRAAVTAALVIAVGGGAAATVHRNAVWRSNLTLWEDTAAKNVTNGLPMRGLAAVYQERGDAAKASEYFQLALRRYNDTAGLFTIYNNLGSLAMVAKKLDEAGRYYRSALGLQPRAPDALFNLALISLTRVKEESASHDESWRREEAERARQLFDQAEQLSPLDPDIPLALGETLRIVGDTAGALAQYQRALKLGLPPANEAAVRTAISQLQ